MLDSNIIPIGNGSISYKFKFSGDPVIIFLYGGMGDINQSTWDSVLNLLPKNYSYLTFDRPGIGLSKHTASPRTAFNIAEELKILLDHLQITKVVLLGHSIGGLYARYFASKYPEYITGLILLDSTHEKQFERNSEFISKSDLDANFQAASNNPERINIPEDPNESFEQIKFYPSIPNSFHSIIIAAENSMPSEIPYSNNLNRINIELQRDLSLSSPNSEFIVAEKCSHFIYIDRPDLVINSLEMLIGRK